MEIKEGWNGKRRGKWKAGNQRMKTIHIPKELLWDYKEPPPNLLRRLQRIADFFPACGTERQTVKLLFKYRGKLKMEEATYSHCTILRFLGALGLTVLPPEIA